MMKPKKFMMIALVVVLALTALPVAAQDGGEDTPLSRDEMIAVVIAAYDNLSAAEFYAFEANQTENQTLISGEGVRQVTFNRTNTRAIEGRTHIVTGAPDEVEVEVEQSSRSFVNGQSQNARSFNMNLSLLQIGGILYAQVTDIEGTLFEEIVNRLSSDERQLIQGASYFPLPWVDITNNPSVMAAQLQYLDSSNTSATFLESLNLEALANGNSDFRLSPEMIVNIQLDGVGASGEQVFIIDLDPLQLLETLNLVALFQDDVLPEDVDALLLELFEGTSATQTLTVSKDRDGNPVLSAVETEVAIAATFSPEHTSGLGFVLQSQVQTSISYSNLGRSFSLTAPEIAVPESAEAEVE